MSGFGVWVWRSGIGCRNPGRGVRAESLMLRVSGSGSRISGCGLRDPVSGSGYQVSEFGCRPRSSRPSKSSFEFRVSGFGFRVSDFGFWVSGFGSGVRFGFPVLGIRVSRSRVAGSGLRDSSLGCRVSCLESQGSGLGSYRRRVSIQTLSGNEVYYTIF